MEYPQNPGRVAISMNFHQIRLWVDDLRDPQGDDAKRKGASGDEMWVTTPDEANSIISTGNVVSISLDGDLGIDENGKDLSGTDVSKFIQGLALHNQIPRLKWAIHTDNGGKFRAMTMDLTRADDFWDKHEQVD